MSYLGAPVWQSKSSFLARRGALVPYRQVELEAMGEGAITEVVLGPKNITPTETVRSYLNARDHGGVKITRSKATYR
jgi:hypothetical protein